MNGCEPVIFFNQYPAGNDEYDENKVQQYDQAGSEAVEHIVKSACPVGNEYCPRQM
jgi:hypothetical protein